MLTSPAPFSATPTAQATPDTRGEVTQTALDADALGRLTALDPSGANHLIERVLKAFQASAARQMPQLEAARHRADVDAVRLVAHTLKSSAASIGALDLSKRSAEIETALRLDPHAALDAAIDSLTSALVSALGAIERMLAEPPR